jgi:hypothetical protein
VNTTETFDGYLRVMRERFAQKDAARLPKRMKGTITFLFARPGSGRDRMTLRFADGGVVIDAATRLTENEPTAIVRCALPDWIAFYEKNDTARLDDIDIFGDAALIEALPALASQKTSPLQTRLMR